MSCLKHTAIATISLGVATSLSGCAPDITNLLKCPAPENKPVTVTKEEYKSYIRVLDSRAIGTNGKIVTYKNYLLVDEPKKGIHIFDNSSPAAPVALSFLEIPEHTVFFVKDDLLHVGSHRDLVQLDISDINNIYEVSRGTDIFNAPSIYRFGWFNSAKFPVDTTTSVIVGLEKYTEPQEGCGEDAQ